MDFTLRLYKQLLDALIVIDYTFQPFAGFLEKPASRCIILRHDVETRYGISLTWVEELLLQNVKNVVKRLVVGRR